MLAIRVLLALVLLATAAPAHAAYFLGALAPDDRAQVANRYERQQTQFRLPLGATTIAVVLNDDSGNVAGTGLTLAQWPEVRIVVDPWDNGAAPALVSPWLTGPGRYSWTFDTTLIPTTRSGVPVGNHVLHFEARKADGTKFPAHSLGVLFSVGPVVGSKTPQLVWASSTKFDVAYGDVPWGVDMPVAIPYAGLPVHAIERNYPVRATPSWGGRNLQRQPNVPASDLRPDQLWVTVYGSAGPAGLFRGFAEMADGAVTTAMKQSPYHYYDHPNRQVALVDGPKGIGKAGHAWELRIDKTSGDPYGLASQGRLMVFHRDGRLTTVVGWRNKVVETVVPLAATWPELPPYWENPGHGLELVGDWTEVAAAGWPVGFLTPQGFDFLGAAPQDGRHRSTYAIADSGNDQILGVEVGPTADGKGIRRRVYPIAKLPPGSFPWGISQAPDGWLYVTLFKTHKIVRVHPETKVVEDVWVSAKQPTFGAALIPGWGEFGSSDRGPAFRAKWVADGISGVGSFPFMQWNRVDSKGKLVVMNRYGFALAELDLAQPIATRTLHVFSTPLAGYPETALDLRDTWGDVSVDGTVGALDDVFVTAWGQQALVAVSRAGAWKGAFFPEGATRMLYDGPGDLQGTLEYPGGVSVGAGQVAVNGVGTTSGIRVLSLRLATDPGIDAAKYGRGLWYYRTGGDTSVAGYPSFTLSHGTYFQGGVAPRSVNELAALPDAELSAYILAGMGTGVPRPKMSAAAVSDLSYFIRWQGRLAHGPMRPIGTPVPPPPDTVAPVVTFTNPVAGQTITGSFQIQVTASDNVGVHGALTVTLDGQPVPIGMQLDSTMLANGPHVLVGQAVDDAGNTGQTTLTFAVANVPPDAIAPVITFATPAPGEIVKGTVPVSVAATDNSGIAPTLTITLDGLPVTPGPWDTTRVADGPHTFVATAVDKAGNTAQTTVVVQVQNTPPKPKVTITVPAGVELEVIRTP